MRGPWGILIVAGMLALADAATGSRRLLPTTSPSAWMSNADNDAAIAACTRMIAAGKPKDLHTAYNNRGAGHSINGDHDAAIADYNQAIRLNGRDFMYFRNRGDSWQSKDEHDKAIADYNQAIRLAPKDAVSYNNRGVSYFEKGDYKRALADYTKAISLDAKNYDLLSQPRRCLCVRRQSGLHQGRWPNTIVRPAWMRRTPRPSTAAVSRITALGSYDRAITDFDRAIRLKSDDVQYFRNRGDAWAEKNEPTRAFAGLRSCGPHEPAGCLVAICSARLLHEKLGNHEKARADFNATLSASVGDDIDEAYQKARDRLAALPSATVSDAPPPRLPLPRRC